MQLPTTSLKYRWVILAVVWLSYLNVFLTRLSIGPLAPFLKDAFHLSNAQIGTLVSATVVTYAPALIISGWLVDRVGVRRMLIMGTLIMGLCVGTLFLTPSYQFMLIILALSGFGAGFMFPTAVKAIILWFPVKERATAVGFNQAAVNVGGIIGASMLPTVAVTLGWRYGFLFVGLSALTICLCCALLYRDPPREAQSVTAANTNVGAARKLSATRVTLFKSRDIWMLGFACLFLAIIEFSAMSYLVLYLKENLLFGVVVAGGILAMTEAAGGLGKPLSGFLSDRLLGGRRKIILLFMAGTASAMCLILGFAGHVLGWLLYPVLIILGIVALGWGGIYATMAGELGGEESAGTTTGTTAAIIAVGVITGPPAFGFIVDSTGSFQAAWLAMALAGAISLVFGSLIRERKK